jgi:phytoene/squalene synthetase
MQMTNILRYLAADYRAGRIYLPRQELVRPGIEPADLGREQPSSALKTYWLELARETLNRYQTVRRISNCLTIKRCCPCFIVIVL